MPDPNATAARYRARDGTEHHIIVQRTIEGRWRVLDRVADHAVLVETLTGHDDRREQAESLARDYATEQLAYHAGERPDDPLQAHKLEASEESAWAA